MWASKHFLMNIRRAVYIPLLVLFFPNRDGDRVEGREVYKKKPFCATIGWGSAGMSGGRAITMSISFQYVLCQQHSCSTL